MLGKISLLIFIHCVYSMFRYRKYLHASQEPFEFIPVDIAVQIVVASTIAIIAILSYTGQFKNLRQFLPVKTYDASFSSKNLSNFNSSRAELFLEFAKKKNDTETFPLSI